MIENSFDKYVALLDEVDTKQETTKIEDIIKDGFNRHILDRKKQYWEEKGEGYRIYQIIVSSAKLIEQKKESFNRGDPKKDHSFTTYDIDELYQYQEYKIKVRITEARSGNKRYTINVYLK